MNADMRPIGMDEFKNLISGWAGEQTLLDAAVQADPLLAAYYGDELLGFTAFIPASAISDSAYIWVHTTEAVNNHRLATARMSRRWIKIFHSRYPRLVGHCFPKASTMSWLSFVGAQFGEPDRGLVQFEIRG